MTTKKELEKRIRALEQLNDLLLKQTTEQRKVIESMGLEAKESSMGRWVV